MKLYNEKEIGSILKRAAELSHDDTATNSLGLSLDELKQLGKEAGINPDFILKAATEMGASSARSQKKAFWGGPASYTNEMVLDQEISASDWEEMLTKIRAYFKDPGIVTTRENTFEWTIQQQTVKAQVTARLENGKTHIHLFWSEPTAPIPFFIPTMMGTIISLPVVFEALNMSGLPGAFTVMSVALTLFSLGRWGLSAYTDRFSNKLDQLMTHLELIASRNQSSTQTPEERHEASVLTQGGDQRLDLDAFSTEDDESDRAGAAQPARKQRS